MKGFYGHWKCFILQRWELWHQLAKEICLSTELVKIFKCLITSVTLNGLLTPCRAQLQRMSIDVDWKCLCMCLVLSRELSPDGYLSLSPVKEQSFNWNLSLLSPLLWAASSDLGWIPVIWSVRRAVAAWFRFQALKMKRYLSIDRDVGNVTKKLPWVLIQPCLTRSDKTKNLNLENSHILELVKHFPPALNSSLLVFPLREEQQLWDIYK